MCLHPPSTITTPPSISTSGERRGPAVDLFWTARWMNGGQVTCSAHHVVRGGSDRYALGRQTPDPDPWEKRPPSRKSGTNTYPCVRNGMTNTPTPTLAHGSDTCTLTAKPNAHAKKKKKTPRQWQKRMRPRADDGDDDAQKAKTAEPQLQTPVMATDACRGVGAS
ncbi:hypothetical protein LX36DRAFT_676411, partial [Colletotrichum falcatum]